MSLESILRWEWVYGIGKRRCPSWGCYLTNPLRLILSPLIIFREEDRPRSKGPKESFWIQPLKNKSNQQFYVIHRTTNTKFSTRDSITHLMPASPRLLSSAKMPPEQSNGSVLDSWQVWSCGSPVWPVTWKTVQKDMKTMGTDSLDGSNVSSYIKTNKLIQKSFSSYPDAWSQS